DEENVTGDDIGYVDQAVVDSFGNYSFKFMFDGFEFDENGNVTNYTISLKHGDEDITTTVKQAVATRDLTKASISVTPNASQVIADVSIDNLYKQENLTYCVVLAGYSANNALVSAVVEPDVVDIDKTITDLSYTMNEDTVYVKAYIWESLTSLIPLTGVEKYVKGNIDSCLVTYPTYTTKAVTINLDDGDINSDRILVDLFREKGVNAAFNLTYGTAKNCAEYEGFEIANHTTHIKMNNTDPAAGTVYTYDECVDSIDSTKAALASYIGEENVTGLVWPYYEPYLRDDYEQLLEYARQQGYLYARGVGDTGNFNIPEDWMKWKCSSYTTNALVRAQAFAAQPATDELQMFSIWGHSFDLEDDAMLELYNSIIDLVINDEIWNPTPSEFVKYVEATKKLDITDTYIYNPTDIAIYAIVNGAEIVIAPNSYAEI
ncbi:MAG: polysaccharide deacetylase family protein, partial [Oscillospiraceae bacterium]|nr:polysaccharide deacetylase family protein [Oscillospiraceae bacterium]